VRPYPDEIIQGIRWSLENAVIPDLSNEWPQNVARTCLSLLTVLETRWRTEPELLIQDTAEMRGLFQTLVPAFGEDPLAGDESLAALGREMQATLRGAYMGEDEYPSVRVLARENEAFRQTLVHVIEGMEDVAGEGRHNPEFEELRHEIRSLLRRQMDRDNALALPSAVLPTPPQPAAASEK
jgi:hypothetical protein